MSEATTLQELPPELAQKYELLELLGQGGMGAVYKVRNRLSKQIVALKVLLTDRSNDMTAVLRFKREAEAASKLSHANVVAINDFGIMDDVPYLVMEFVPGKSLADVIAKEKIHPERFRQLFLQTCDALSHAHESGVVHRDLKPSNILLFDRSGEGDFVKLADFGIARLTTGDTTQNLTKTGDICGSPLYMSPEQCAGQIADERSDIFSLGCVMYEAITGKVPNAGENTLETIHRRSNERPRSFSDLGVIYPQWIEKIIMRCLERDPQMRYGTVRELKADLQSGVANQSKKLSVIRLSIISTVVLAGGIGIIYYLLNSIPDPFVVRAAEYRQAAVLSESASKLPAAREQMNYAFKLLMEAPEGAKRDKETVAFMREYTKLYALAHAEPPLKNAKKKSDNLPTQEELPGKTRNRRDFRPPVSAPISPPVLQGATNGTIGPTGGGYNQGEDGEIDYIQSADHFPSPEELAAQLSRKPQQ